MTVIEQPGTESEKKLRANFSVLQLSSLSASAVEGVAALEDESLARPTIVNALNDPELDQPNLVAPRFLIRRDVTTYLRVIVPKWDNFSIGDVIYFLKDTSKDVDNAIFDYEVEDDKAEYEIDIPTTAIWRSDEGHGTFVLSYVVEKDNGNVQNSKAAIFTLDAINPFKNVAPAPLLLPADLPAAGVITGDYLNRHPTVALTLPSYTENDYRKFDQFAIVVNDDRSALVWLDLPQDSGYVYNAPSAAVRSLLREGNNTLQVLFRDYSWNLSQLSQKTDVQFREAGVPTGLRKPVLSKVMSNQPGIITLIDAKFGVDVRADYTNALATDLIEVYFDDIRIGQYTAPANGFKALAAVFNKNEGFYDGKFKYRVQRGGLWSEFSPETEVKVDLRIPEPKPEYPEYINERLPLLLLQVPGSLDNTVQKANPRAGVITIPLLPSTVAGTVINVHIRFLTQDIDELESGNRRTITDEDVARGSVKVDVSWSTLQDLLPSGYIGAFYRLRVADGASYMESPHTRITSDLTDLTLTQGEFNPRRVYTNRKGVKYINCDVTKVWEGVDFLVTHSAGFKPTDILRASFTVTEPDGTTPQLTFDYTAEIRNPTGTTASFIVPFEAFFSKVPKGEITAHWQIVGKLPGGSGITDPAREYVIQLDRVRPGGAICIGPLKA